MTEALQPKPRSRRPFFMVLGLFFAPLLLAFAIYYGSDWRPAGTTNKGELITPPVPLPQVALQQADGNTTPATFLRQDWTLLYLGAGDCDAVCRTALLSTNNVRQLLGKDMHRIARVFLYHGACCDAQSLAGQADLLAVSIDDAAGRALLKLFPANHGEALSAGRIYLVDPLGNLMMSYRTGVDPRDIYQDLKKLLTLSHIG